MILAERLRLGRAADRVRPDAGAAACLNTFWDGSRFPAPLFFMGLTMQVILISLYRVLMVALDLYTWALIISAVLSWLVAFNVINTRNRAVYTVMDLLYRVTEPALRPIRRMLPNMGGVDISPIILILILYFLQNVLSQLVLSAVM